MTFDNIANALIVVLATILLDTLMGIFIAIKQGTFEFNKLPQFLATNVLPYVGGLIVTAMVVVYVKELSWAFYGAVALVAVRFSKQALLDKMKILFE